jgi:opacity protein-like surface antigen
MNKLLTSIASVGLLAMSYSTSASSIELPELRVGATANSVAYYGVVKEKLKDSARVSEKAAVAIDAFGSMFAELSMEALMGLTVGIEYAPDNLAIKETRSLSGREESVAGSGETAARKNDANSTQTISISISDSYTAYVSMPIPGVEGLYVRAGLQSMDIITKESLASGSSYGNETLNGVQVGIGYSYDINDRFFVRTEGLYTQFDDIGINGSEVGGTSGSYNRISADDLGAASARVSLGLKF